MSGQERFGGTKRLGTLLVGRSTELPDVVLKYEVVERDGDRYVLRRPGHPGTLFHGHVASFALLATQIFQARQEFNCSHRGTDADEAWKRERERIMGEWDCFPTPDPTIP